MNGPWNILPLNWEVHEFDCGVIDHIAETVFGTLTVTCEKGGSCTWGYHFCEYHDEKSGAGCESVEDGKAQAEKLYLGRLMGALIPVDERHRSTALTKA